MTHSDGQTKPESKREGDIDDDRQDPPAPTGSDDQDLDAFTATPGDDPEEDR